MLKDFKEGVIFTLKVFIIVFIPAISTSLATYVSVQLAFVVAIFFVILYGGLLNVFINKEK